MRILPTPRRSIVGSLVVLVICCGRACAADAPAAVEVEPAAQKVLDGFGKYFSGLKSFRCAVQIAIGMEQQGVSQQHEVAQKISAERPNKLVCTIASQQAGAEIVSDGAQLSVYFKMTDKYGSEEAPATWQGILQNPLVLGAMSMGNAALVSSAMLDADPAKKLLEKCKTVRYGGLVTLDGKKCHLLEASGEMDWQLWIDAGDKPLVRKFVPDLAKAIAQMARQAKAYENMKITNVVTFKDWEVNPAFAADTFAFKAPEGATRAKTIMDILMGDSQTGPHPLLGQAAPDVKLELLDGGTLDLARYKNKNVVILDFWATWCGPCVQAMPIIEAVAKRFENKGVLLFAVNVQEEADDIHTFLDEKKAKVSVALDKEGDMAKAYQATAIPQTVLVGKDGTVQVVFVGFSPGLADELAKSLDALVAGKDLAAEARAAAKDDETKDSDAAKPAKNPDAKAGKK